MMDPDDQNRKDKTDAELPLPKEAGAGTSKRQPHKAADRNPAADLIRKKVEAAYANEPEAGEELSEAVAAGGKAKRSKHQEYIYQLSNSGKSLAEIQEAWHEYYAGLSDKEKHAVWKEFYEAHSRGSQYKAHTAAPEEQSKPHVSHARNHQRRPTHHSIGRRADDLRQSVKGSLAALRGSKPPKPLQSLLFGLMAGSVVIFIFLFGLFNERFIAPFIQPSRTVTNTPIIADASVAGPDPEIIIPKINVEIPVVYGLGTVEEKAVQEALEDGVVHYSYTPVPGEAGNVVIVGHSSNNIFNTGKYKFAFVLLSRMEQGDTFYLDKDGKRYTYEIYEKKVVKPNDLSVLEQQDEIATATLITCDPPGSTANRLVVVGRQISPDPGGNLARTDAPDPPSAAILPGNAPSLWSRFVNWFTG